MALTLGGTLGRRCIAALRRGDAVVLRLRLGSRHLATTAVVETSAQTASKAGVVGTAAKASEAAAESSLMARATYWPSIYLELGKVRLSGLVVATTVSGYYMGCEHFDPAMLGWTVMGTTMAALSANSINQWIEIANDGKMGRTLKRPLPSGRISPNHALAFGITSGTMGSGLLAATVNPLAGGLALSNILLYTGVYTPLKVRHPINTWAGAVVGGIPPLIGYAAATGTLDANAGLLAAVLFSWQFPHFMALAHYCKKDYLAGGYQMLSDKRAAGVALRHSLYLVPMGLAAPAMGLTSVYFGAESLLINGYMVYKAYQFHANPTILTARKLFRTSLWHLPALLALMALHKEYNTTANRDEEHWSGELAPMLETSPSMAEGLFSLPTRCTRYAIDEIANGPRK